MCLSTMESIREQNLFLRQAPKITIENGIIKGEKYVYPKNGYLNYGEYLLEKMKANSSFIAQVDDVTGFEDTFGNMADRSVRCALWLKDQKLQPGDVVAFCTSNHLNTIISFMSCLQVGLIFNPWSNINLSTDKVKHFLKLTNPKVLFVNEEHAMMIKEIAMEMGSNLQIVVYGQMQGFESFENIIGKQDEEKVKNFQCTKLPNADHPAFIIYTSGTTGLPKGVLHSHKSLFVNAELVGRSQGDSKVVAICSQSFWISGIMQSFGSITAIKKRIFTNEDSVDGIIGLVEKFQIGFIKLSTNRANTLSALGNLSNRMSSLRVISISGAIFDKESQNALQLALPHTIVSQSYGASELCSMVFYQTTNENYDSIGWLSMNLEMKIIDLKNGRILGANEEGELCLKSPSLMLGYYNDPEKTKEVIDSEGWFHTRDCCYYDNNGLVYYIGRITGIIQCGNFNVMPEIIERKIRSHPGVFDVGVTGIPIPRNSTLLGAVVIKMKDSNVTEKDIIKLVENDLPEHMWLGAGVLFVDALPIDSSQKLSRPNLKNLAINSFLSFVKIGTTE